MYEIYEILLFHGPKKISRTVTHVSQYTTNLDCAAGTIFTVTF